MPTTDHANFQGAVCPACRGLVFCWPMPEPTDAFNSVVQAIRDQLGLKIQAMTRAAMIALPRCNCLVPGFVAGPEEA